MPHRVMMTFCGLAALALATPAAAESVTVNCEFGETEMVSISPEDSVFAARKARTDACTSDNPDFDGGTAAVLEQLWGGDSGVYNLFVTAKTPDGDLFFGVNGAWPAKTEGFGFEGEGPILGGTGKYAGAAGSVKQLGNTKDGVTGNYKVVLTLD